MIRSVRIIACGIAVSLGATVFAGAAQAGPLTAISEPGVEDSRSDGKRLQRRGDRRDHHYRDRRSSHRDHDRRRHHDRYRRHHRDDYRAYQPYRSHCWSDTQRAAWRGQPALISVRMCRDRHGRVYTVRGSARLIRYLRGHHRPW